jgi:hypothetical protein
MYRHIPVIVEMGQTRIMDTLHKGVHAILCDSREIFQASTEM